MMQNITSINSRKIIVSITNNSPESASMWTYILVFIIILYALYKEREALGCRGIFDGKDCDNDKGKAVEGSISSKNDNTPEILDKIEYAADYQLRFVKWRAFLIVAFLTTILLWFVVFQKFPREWELVVGILILFVAMSSATGFYLFHLYDHIKKNIDKSTDILRKRYRFRTLEASDTSEFSWSRPYPY